MEPVGTTKGPSQPLILVVDDDPEWRELVRLGLEDSGYRVIEASDGKEALALISRERPSLVLLDVTMPEMSGEEVVKKLPPHSPPVVLLTCKSAEEVRKTLYNGPHYYLPKEAASTSLPLLVQSLIPSSSESDAHP